MAVRKRKKTAKKKIRKIRKKTKAKKTVKKRKSKTTKRSTKKSKRQTKTKASKSRKSKVKKPKGKVKKVLKRRRSTKKGKKARVLALSRALKNPIITPNGAHWESEAVFNPGAVIHGGRVHLFYRALGYDGVSRVGYASSKDGIHFDKRSTYPVYMPETFEESKKHHPYTSPARLSYDRVLYASGGGWGGCEDPRAVKIGDRIYMTFNIFNGWNSIRVGVTSIAEKDLEEEKWNWSPLNYLSPANQRHKNWVLFPEKVDGRYALLHNLYHADQSQVCIEYIDDIEKPIPAFVSHDPHLVPDREIVWHNRTRSAGPPPVKTKYGWLIFYHAMDKNDPGRYKLGVMLLDPNDPKRILYRSSYPILEPDEWYENDWKPGIIYASGAVVKDNTLFIYYGGGDKYIGVASANLDDFVHKLMRNEHIEFSKKSTKVT